MRLCKAVASWLLLGLVPTVSFALGLGEIRLNSALNQPFSAEVPLESVSEGEFNSLRVSMADRESFERLKLDRPVFLSDFSFNVRKNDAGEPIVKIMSRVPVSEPFVTFLLDVKWANGRFQREYTVLLDPPVFDDIAVQSPVAVDVIE
ncbi:MAG: type IV pilus assembly protein FimV, partial [Gammaproteobacteria bacterium]